MKDHLHHLPSGFRLGEYETRGVLGTGEIGLKYLGIDHSLGEPVAILEYLPSSVAIRRGPTSVMPASSAVETRFRELLRQFVDEAGALAQFQHPNMIRVRRVLQVNGTGYVVMDYADGRTLSAVLRECRTIGNADLDTIAKPVLDVVEKLHNANLLHQDIRPGNIVIRDDGRPLLLAMGAVPQGIGAARQVFDDKWRNRHAALSPSAYAPLELYSNSGKPGPWTDVYSLGATLYHCVTGLIPPSAPERIMGQAMSSVAQADSGAYGSRILAGIDAALAIQPEDRPQNVAEWREILGGESRERQRHNNRSAPVRTSVRGLRLPDGTGDGSAETRSQQSRWVWPSLALTAATAVVVYVDAGLLRSLENDRLSSNPPRLQVLADNPSEQPDSEELRKSVESDVGAVLGAGESILVVETDPLAVEVVVAGQVVGETPLRLTGLPTGMFDIALRHPYYETIEIKDQHFESLREVRIERALTRATGGLIVTTEPAGAWVEANDRRVIQRTPGTARNLPAGPVRLTLGADGHRTMNVLGEVPKGGMGYLSQSLQRNRS